MTNETATDELKSGTCHG